MEPSIAAVGVVSVSVSLWTVSVSFVFASVVFVVLISLSSEFGFLSDLELSVGVSWLRRLFSFEMLSASLVPTWIFWLSTLSASSES